MCSFRYQFLPAPQFEVDHATGVLAANEEIFTNIFYTSKIDEIGDKIVEIICRVQCIYKNSLVDESVDIPVTVILKFVYTELCVIYFICGNFKLVPWFQALPSSYQCGEVNYGTVIETCFYIYNFGEAKINFKLCHDHDLKHVSLNPVIGKCGSKEKLIVKLRFTVTRIGKHTLFISYNNRLDRYTETLAEEGGKIIFRVHYTCTFPTLQVNTQYFVKYDTKN